MYDNDEKIVLVKENSVVSYPSHRIGGIEIKPPARRSYFTVNKTRLILCLNLYTWNLPDSSIL